MSIQCYRTPTAGSLRQRPAGGIRWMFGFWCLRLIAKRAYCCFQLLMAGALAAGNCLYLRTFSLSSLMCGPPGLSSCPQSSAACTTVPPPPCSCAHAAHCRSADVYEYSTEALFFGRQDAMQRTSLLPIAEWMREQRRPDSSVRLLEVACGTGRFHTFIKVRCRSCPCVDLCAFGFVSHI